MYAKSFTLTGVNAIVISSSASVLHLTIPGRYITNHIYKIKNTFHGMATYSLKNITVPVIFQEYNQIARIWDDTNPLL